MQNMLPENLSPDDKRSYCEYLIGVHTPDRSDGPLCHALVLARDMEEARRRVVHFMRGSNLYPVTLSAGLSVISVNGRRRYQAAHLAQSGEILYHSYGIKHFVELGDDDLTRMKELIEAERTEAMLRDVANA
jgi:hypothetical protein